MICEDNDKDIPPKPPFGKKKTFHLGSNFLGFVQEEFVWGNFVLIPRNLHAKEVLMINKELKGCRQQADLHSKGLQAE